MREKNEPWWFFRGFLVYVYDRTKPYGFHTSTASQAGNLQQLVERASRRLLVKVHVYAAETDIHLAALVSNESQNDEKYWHYIKYLNRCVCGISKIFINLFLCCLHTKNPNSSNCGWFNFSGFRFCLISISSWTNFNLRQMKQIQ